MNSDKHTNYYIRLPLFIFIALAIGILIGATFRTDSESFKGDLTANILKMREVMSNIARHYVDPVDLDDLTETAINEMLHKLDPHSSYIPKSEMDLAKVQIEGKFSGIGIEFNIFKDTIYVIAPLSGGPSEKLGIQSGDKIIEVDGENVAGIGINNRGVIDRLRGEEGSEVKVKIKRKRVNELLEFNIVRDEIPQYSVDASYMVDDEVGYIKVSRFSATTYDEFREAVKKLKDMGMEKLVLDLQGNPGGLMSAAIGISDELIAGDKMIVYTKARTPQLNQEARARMKGMMEEDAVIVLIDEGSASASEIVAGALQDNDRALIVGRRSFGKGLVQMPIPLDDGSELRLTISRYYTPSGRSIQKPYDEDFDNYYSDREERFDHGEFFHADSIKFADSLKYNTLNGRTVYGGGGITPDYFVPLDTSGNSSYLTQLIITNALREYTFKYYNENKKKLEKMELDEYIEDFEVSESMLSDLISTAEGYGVKFNEEQYKKSKELIKINVKAMVARSVWNNDGFYPIINDLNEMFQKALLLFDEAEKLALNN